MSRWFFILFGLVTLWLATVGLFALMSFYGNFYPSRAIFLESPRQSTEVGQIIDSWRGIPVRYNGAPYWRSVGKHSAQSGYYYGKQWQCVEYIKRFYYDALKHEMPEVMGHADSFFNSETPHGQLNIERNLIQFKNGQQERPQVDDLIVWQQDTYGHVAIVCKVLESSIEVVQQNVVSGSRQRLTMTISDDGSVWVGAPSWRPAGWLRKK